jgi:ribosomal protein L31E
MAEQRQKKRKITCVIRGNDEDLELIEGARNAAFEDRKNYAITIIKHFVSNQFGYDKNKLSDEIKEIEARIQLLKDILLRGVDEIDFDTVPAI